MTKRKIGDGIGFEDVEKIREELATLEMDTFGLEEEMNKKILELGELKTEIKQNIENKTIELKNDKEARKEAGFTNDRDWLHEIKNNLLKNYIKEQEQFYKDLEKEIEDYKHHIVLKRLRIKNLERKLRNRQIYMLAILNRRNNLSTDILDIDNKL